MERSGQRCGSLRMGAQSRQSEGLPQRGDGSCVGNTEDGVRMGVREVMGRLVCTSLVLVAALSHSQASAEPVFPGLDVEYFSLNGGLHRSGSATLEKQLW